MPSPGEVVTNLAKLIGQLGSMNGEDAKHWLLENGAKNPKAAGLMLGQGLRNNRWHREGDLLLPGPAPERPVVALTPSLEPTNGHIPEEPMPVLPASPSAPTPAQPAAPPPIPERPLADVRDEMITAATGIGIPGNWANAIATYLVRSYDVYDPAQVWEGLSEVMEVPISHRKRFFKTWMSYISTEVPQSLEERIRSIAPSYEDQRVPTASAKAKPQKFYAMDGEVLRCPADAEDELGVSWLTAVQMAKQQVEKARSLQPVAPATPARQDESVQVEMVRQMGESSRQTLELLAGVGGEDPEKKVLAQQLEAERLSNLRTELQAQMDRQNQETRHQMDLMSGQLTTSLTELTRAVTAIAQGASKPPATIIDSLKELAGLKEQLGVLFPQPAPPQQAFNFPMGPNGEMVPMSLDNMFRFAEFQDKRETVGAVRKSLPTLIKLGDDLVKAFRAETAAVAAAAPGAAAGAESAAIPLGPRTDNVALPAPEPDEPLRTSRCPACNEANHYPRGDWALICGNCHAPLYTRGGSELMLVPSETLEPELVSAEVPEGGPEMADPVTATPVEVEPTSVVLGSVMEVPAEATIA